MISSVVICTKNRQNEILKCIDSIVMQSVKPEEVIIIDASNNLGIEKIIADKLIKDKDIEYKYLHTKSGLTYQRNRGVEIASGEIIMFLDDDVILENDYIKEIIRVFENDSEKKIGGIGGNITNTHLSKIRFERLIKKLFFLSDNGDGFFKHSGSPTRPFRQKENLEVECLPGCMMSYRSDVFKNFSFDENMKMYCYMEDCDFSYRVSRKFKNYYVASAKAIHNSSSPKTKKEFAEKTRYLIVSHHYLFMKNFPKNYKNRLCHYISLLGFIVLYIRLRNWWRLKGAMEAIKILFLRKCPKEFERYYFSFTVK